MRMLSLPNLLTLTRLVLSPLMLPVLLVYLLPFNSFFINVLLALVFVALSLTDLLDGYLARRFGQVTKLGKRLDPIADKFLAYSALVALLAAGKIFFYWVIILIGRDFFVMGLRAIARDHNVTLPVSFLGKVKTTVQMIFLAFFILNPYQSAGFFNSWNIIEYLLLGAVLGLCVLTAKGYYDHFVKNVGPLGQSLDAGSSQKNPSGGQGFTDWPDEQGPSL